VRGLGGLGPREGAAAVLSGVLYFVSFPGFDVWPLAFVCLVPLHLAIGRADTGRQAARLGLVMGFVTNWGGYYWLVGMLETFSGFPLPVCVIFASVLCLYQGALFAVYAWLLHAGTRARISPLWAAPTAMVVVEFAYPLLFPSYTANCLHPVVAFIQATDVFGPLGLTAAIVLVNAAIAVAIERRTDGIRASGPSLAVAALVPAILLGYGLVRISQVDARSAASPRLTVGIAQSNMGVYQKHEDPEEGLRRHQSLSKRLLDDGELDLLIWPESAYVYALPENVRTVRRRVLGGLPGPLLFGGIQRRGGKLYNTALLTDETGRIVDSYDKVYLLAFGEYLPLGEVFPVLHEWSPHSGRFTKGTDFEPLAFGRHRIAALVCYEDILPRFVRDLVRTGDPHLFVNQTNDAWFGRTHEPAIHLALSVFRSVEHRRWLVRATNTGISAIVDPVGRVVRRGPLFRQAAIRGEVRMMRGWTPYRAIGDLLGWVALAATAAFLVRRLGMRAAATDPQGGRSGSRRSRR
jgi:apolipoprotein N-acyltransferase